MANVKITYGDVPPSAKDHFVISVKKNEFATNENLRQNNFDYVNYSSPLEDYQTLLDGAQEPFSSDSSYSHIGIWSEQISDGEGNFDAPVVIVLDSDAAFTTQGFTLVFDNAREVYPTDVTVTWKRIPSEGDTVELATETFHPTSSKYFFQHKVEEFNFVQIKINSLNMPYQRLRVNTLDFGYGTEFDDEQLRNVQITRSIDPISTQLEIGTIDLSLDSNSEMDYSFQSKQKLGIYSNGELLGNAYVKSSTRTAKTMWEVSSEDCLSLLDSCMFYGDIYGGNNAVWVIKEICNTAGVEVDVSEVDELDVVEGYIPYCTCREALMQVLFATGYVSMTEGTDKLKIVKLSDEIKQTIPLERIMQGQSFEEPDIVTEVKLTEHNYERGGEVSTVYTATKADQNKIEDNGSVTVYFDREVYDGELWWQIENKDESGKITSTDEFIVPNEDKYIVGWGDKSVTLQGSIYMSSNQYTRSLLIKAFQYGEGEPTELYVTTKDDYETTSPTGKITLSFDKPYFDIKAYWRLEDKENGSITKTTDGALTNQDKYIVAKCATSVIVKNLIYSEGKDQNEKLIIKGYPYTETTKIHSKKNELALADSTSNVKEITTATLISHRNADEVLDRCFKYLTSPRTVNLRIIEGKNVVENGIVRYGQAKYGEAKYAEDIPDVVTYDKPVNLGDVIQCETEYLGTLTGRVIKQSFNLNGNIIVKDTVLKCYDI